MIFRKLLYSDEGKVSRTEKTLALSIATTVNTLLGTLLSMVAARLLTKTEIAVNSQTFLAYNTVSPFLALGIPSGIYYYLAQNEHRKRGALNDALLLVGASSAIFCLFILCGGNFFLAKTFKNEAVAQTLYFLVPFALLGSLQSVASCLLIYENRLRFNALFNTTQVFVRLTAVLLVILLFPTGRAMVAARSLVGCLFATLNICLARSILPRENSRPQWSGMKVLLAVSIPLCLSSVAGTLDQELDRWIVSYFATPEVYAVYEQGARELPLIGAVTGAISTVVVVDLTKAAKRGDYAVAADLFRKVSEKSSMLLMPVMVFFMAAARPFISFLFTDAFLDAVPVFQIYLLFLPLRVTQYGPLLIALGKSRFIMWKTVCGLFLNAVLSVALFSLFGPPGAALATILILYVFNVPLNLHVISKATGISKWDLLPFRQMFHCILCSLPGAAAVYALGFFLNGRIPAFFILAAGFMLFCAFTLPLFVWKFHLSPKAMLNRLLSMFSKLLPRNSSR